MNFDLYGAIGFELEPLNNKTTLDALAAAEWTGPDLEGVWTLSWDDHTDYGNEPGGGVFTCRLYERNGRWTYELYHSDRAGEVEKELGLAWDEFDEETALVACKVGALAFQMDRWEQGIEEYVRSRQAEEDAA